MAASGRLLALDAFRGLTLALMVLVNTPGDGRFVYGPLRHAAWHGWTVTDLVFPSFVWIVGVALTLALGKRLERGETAGSLLPGIWRRGAILFALGVFLYAVPEFDLGSFRVLGVLQRIAICYVAAALAFLYLGTRGLVVLSALLLAGYWLVVGLGDLSVEGNLAHAVDRAVLGAHNYKNTKTWDPEGVLSTFPAVASCLLGVLVGILLARRESLERRLVWLFVMGCVLLVGGLAWDMVFPINKKLWTSSFVLLVAGIDALALGCLLWWMDGMGWKKWWQPFVVMGSNAIAIYLVSEFVEIGLDALGWKRPIYDAVFAPLASPMNASLLYALAYVTLHFGVAYGMYRRGWFLRV
jgi:predicted acyltransferase